MSRAFVKEGDSPEELPEKPVPEGPNYVTPEGYAELKRRHDELAVRRSELAAKPGAGATPEFRRVERELRYYSARLANATVVDRSGDKPDEALFGAEVSLEDGGSAPSVVRIVGADEADPARGKLSWSSPLALALMGARAGDTVRWEGPDGERRARVVAVRYP